MAKKVQFSKEDLQKIKTSYESGATLKEISIQTGVGRKVIRRIVEEMGILRDKRIKTEDLFTEDNLERKNCELSLK